MAEFRISIREFGSRSHSNGYEDGRKRTPYFQEVDPTICQPTTYRQLVENGKPVPPNQQMRKAPIVGPKRIITPIIKRGRIS